jgi:hypothetical protein
LTIPPWQVILKALNFRIEIKTMKRLIIIVGIVFFVSGYAFAEFQLDTKLGWFFNKDTYESDTSRTFIRNKSKP